MIASLRGVIQALDAGSMVLDVNGVGYLVHVPASQAAEQPKVGDTLRVHTFLHVRENEISLYGFYDRDQLALFKMLLTVQGVGPRTALAVISTFSPQTLRDAVSRGDLTALAKVPGIGRKTAQRMLMDLNDRIAIGGNQNINIAYAAADDDAMSALLALGYSVMEAQQALGQVSPDIPALDERIVAALRYLGGR